MFQREYCPLCGNRLWHGRGSNIRNCKVCWQKVCTRCHIQGYCLDDFAMLSPERQEILGVRHERDKFLKAIFLVAYFAFILSIVIPHAW